MAEPQVASQVERPAGTHSPAPVAGVHDGGAAARGQAAELLAAEAAGGLCGASDAPAGPTPPTEDQLNGIKTCYEKIGSQQILAVQRLERSVREQDPPSLLETLATSLLSGIMAGVMGAVGTLIKGALEGLMKGAASAAAKAFTDGLTDFVKSCIDSTVQAIWQRATLETQDPVRQFFQAQEDILIDLNQQLAIEYDSQRRAQLRGQSREDVEAMRQALLVALKGAYRAQWDQTLQAWISAKAQSGLGRTQPLPKALGAQAPELERRAGGTFMGDEVQSPGSDFVLQVEAVLSEPGEPVRIQSASLPGSNQNMRNFLVERPLGTLAVPLVVEGISPRAGQVRVARNEKQLIWEGSDRAGRRWLGQRDQVDRELEGSRPEPTLGRPGRRPEGAIRTWVSPDRAVENGARLLIEKDMSTLMIGKEQFES